VTGGKGGKGGKFYGFVTLGFFALAAAAERVTVPAERVGCRDHGTSRRSSHPFRRWRPG
jgi:hypothetical protein